ncbi:GGDEF domain-containing protein [Krasilnikovia sp. MM14-A1259]|uniref:GGDEF domain-containing protein n=1 Tax=Krasilnikovia sp. MM14-A1259 TaxID=3373539 RepID=UPI00382077DC
MIPEILTAAMVGSAITAASAAVLLRRTRAELRVARYDATHDRLTGLLGRAGVDAALEERADSRRAWSMIMFDLDDFKQVNDNFGHDVGDEVLVKASHRLFMAFDQPGDVVGRLGGDEFVVLTDNGPYLPLLTWLRALNGLIAVREAMGLASGDEVTVTASVGVVSVLPGAELPRVRRSADIATYRAKARGGNQVVEYGLPGELATVHSRRPNPRLRDMATAARSLRTVTR